MKYIFTFLLSASIFSAKAQTPQCLVYHGCGGATVVAYQGDLGWSALSYDFQRFQGGSWVTIHNSVSNYHIVLNGDITIASNYRAVLRNSATSEERISNGAIVDPAKFNDAVTKPKPTVTFYWGTSVTSGQNYVEVNPGNFGLSGYRPPFTYSIKKKNSFVFDQKISTTGIFFTNNIEANQEYVFTVTDYCGNVDSTTGAFGFAAFGRVTARNCSGASIELSSVTQGQNAAQRLPVTFAVAPIADSIYDYNMPNSILAGLNYTFSAGISTGFTATRYVVRAKDAYGVLSAYSLINTGLSPLEPNIISTGPSSGFCNLSITLAGNPLETGIRRVSNDTLPFTFTPGATIAGIRAGFSYEIVVKDSCGRISKPLLQSFNAFQPRITNVAITNNGCSNTLTVTATSCTNNPEYRLQLFGLPPGAWQSSNVFTNVPGNNNEYHKVFVRDGNSALDSSFVYVPALSANVEINQFNGICGERASISIGNISNGKPPYQYAISYDGINFSPFSSNNSFNWLAPGTYDVMVKDSCGNILRSTDEYQQRQVGDWYYVNETGFKTSCDTAEQAGGFIKFGIQQPYNIYAAITTPYQYQLKEITSITGNTIQYGKVVRTGQTSDTSFTISGLPADKRYGIFITNKCGDPVTSKNRAANNFFIPLHDTPEPVFNIYSINCNDPYIEAVNLPAGGVIKIFTGKDTIGAMVNLATPNTSTGLGGGFYTIKVSTPDFNGCPWMQLYEVFVATYDSTSAGTFDETKGGICKADLSIVQLKNFVIGQTHGGSWTGNIPDSNWINRDSGQFITKGLESGIYDFVYDITLCGGTKQLTFSLPINLEACGLSTSFFDVISAGSTLGCKNYEADEWYDVVDEAGRLWYSINPGNGNNLQSVCWGARFRDVFSGPRTITLNSTQLLIASRNFYIEPGQLQVGANPVKVRLYYSNDDMEGLLYYLRNNGYSTATINDLRILKKATGPGSPIDLDVTVDAGAPSSLYSFITPTVHRLGTSQFASWYFEFEVSSFSELALFYAPGSPLPVTWLTVTAQMQEGKSLIKWSTASETNTSSFSVEYSEDGLKFVLLQNIVAAGNSNSVRRYEWIHARPKQGINYYRIRQTDKDGRFSYSKIVTVQYSKNRMPILLVPNPTKDKLTVWLPESSGGSIIRIFNQLGQVVQQQPVAIGATQLQVNASQLQPGYYRLQLLQAGNSQSLPFIKQ